MYISKFGHLPDFFIHWYYKYRLHICSSYSFICLYMAIYQIFVMHVWVRGGQFFTGLCTTASPWRILHSEVRGGPESPAASNISLLFCNSILAAALLIRSAIAYFHWQLVQSVVMFLLNILKFFLVLHLSQNIIKLHMDRLIE